jgi:HAD superfamily hydrolase (TIGR01458 family)
MANPSLSHVKGLLLDLNGVFYVANQLLPGAIETAQQLKHLGTPYRFATNNTTESVGTLSRNLQVLGLEVPAETIISAPYAAMLYLRQKQYSRIYPLLTDDVRADFKEFTFDEMNAEAVVIGDMDNDWNYRMLNRAFKLIMQGAELVALHKGKFWQWEAGLQLDIGAFVAGLEYSTDTQATIIGKPSASFFELALQELGMPPQDVVMVGDDIDADIGGAQAVGMKGVLVKTGKYREHLSAQSGITPDAVVDSIDQVLALLQ